MATLAVIIVPMSTRICHGPPMIVVHPKNPKMMTTGKILGNIETTPAVTLRSTRIITIVMAKKAHPVLSIRLCSSVRCAL